MIHSSCIMLLQSHIYQFRYHRNIQIDTELWGEEEPYVGDKVISHRYPKAAYAGMITYLDDQVGELVTKLKELGLYENTLIIFTSDNGPTYTGGVDAPYFESAAPFVTDYGRTKGFTYEGGIRVPMIAAWLAKSRLVQRLTIFLFFGTFHGHCW